MKSIFTILAAVILFSLTTKAQEFKTASDYMSYIGNESQQVSKQMLAYVSATAHSNRAQKSEAERNRLIEMLKASRDKVAAMPPFEGDAAYRDGVVKYMELNYNVMKQDYEKIMDMEAIAEQSFDLMEAYITAQQEANKKVNEAMDELAVVQKKFGAKYNIKIVESDNEVSKKLEQANEVIQYYNQVYLIFFKSYKQEFYTMDAVKQRNMNAIEQNRNAQIATATEGLTALESIPAFKGDNALKQSCKSALEFHKAEAETDFKTTVDFYVKKENFEKEKKAFEALKAAEKTQERVNQYNQAVVDYNTAVQQANTSNEASNAKRTDITNGWNKTVNDFMEKYIPNK